KKSASRDAFPAINNLLYLTIFFIDAIRRFEEVQLPHFYFYYRNFYTIPMLPYFLLFLNHP
ncbi:TPA: hypothetical protein ACWXSB_005507, partial [Escherichia coli]